MIHYATITNEGSREINEDSLGAYSHDGLHCFVLCDGLGGHGMGDVASQLVRNVFASEFENCKDASHFLAKSFSIAQDFLLNEQTEKRAKDKMKSTCVSLIIDGNSAYIGHVGDSRCYIFRKNKVYKRTLDHSIPQMLVLTREIEEREIRHHPERNYLLRVMGVQWEKPMYELMDRIPLKKCQAFLLCSDGFWELVEEEDMCRLLQEADSPKEWLAKMKEIVVATGAGTNMDNYSAIAVWNV